MSIRGISFKDKGRTVVTIFGVLFIVFVIVSIVIFTTSRSTIDQIEHEPGTHSYYRNESTLYFEIRVTQSTRDFFNNGDSPITDPFFTVSNADIDVYDSDSNSVEVEILSSGKLSYKCYAYSVRIEVWEPTYCYKYQIDVIEHHFKPIQPILLAFAGYILVGLIASLIFARLANKRNPTPNYAPKNFSNDINEIDIKTKEMNYLFEIVKRLPKKRICAISRTQIEPDDEALRCPFCKSYFIREYLIAWLQDKDHCPVCFRSLVKEE